MKHCDDDHINCKKSSKIGHVADVFRPQKFCHLKVIIILKNGSRRKFTFCTEDCHIVGAVVLRPILCFSCGSFIGSVVRLALNPSVYPIVPYTSATSVAPNVDDFMV